MKISKMFLQLPQQFRHTVPLGDHSETAWNWKKKLKIEGFQGHILQGLFTRLVETVTYYTFAIASSLRYSMPPGGSI